MRHWLCASSFKIRFQQLGYLPAPSRSGYTRCKAGRWEWRGNRQSSFHRRFSICRRSSRCYINWSRALYADMSFFSRTQTLPHSHLFPCCFSYLVIRCASVLSWRLFFPRLHHSCKEDTLTTSIYRPNRRMKNAQQKQVGPTKEDGDVRRLITVAADCGVVEETIK